MNSYPKTKPSGVQWIGEVPEHWGISCLKHSVKELYCGGTPESGNPEYWAYDEEESTPWVAIGDMTRAAVVRFTDKRITAAGRASKRLRVLPVGTLLYSMYASLGKVSVLGIPATVNQAILGIVPDGMKCEQDFLRYWLIQMESHLELFSSSNTQDNLNAGKVRALPLVVPPPTEQRFIAAYLDRETGRIDELVGKKRDLIERLKEKRTALISRTVTRGLPADLPPTTLVKLEAIAGHKLPHAPACSRSGLEWVEEIPSHWITGPLKGFARRERKTFTDGDWVELPFITDEGVRLIQTGNVGIGAYKEQGFRFVSEESFAVLGCTEVFPNDVLICRLDGPVGRACLAPDLGVRMITSVDNTILKPNSETSAEYVVRLLSSDPWLQWIEALCRVGGGFRIRISRLMLGNIRVPIPPLPEQRAIAAYLDEETAKLDALVAKVETAIERLQEYRTALITAAVTGKIDVRTPKPTIKP